MVIAALAGLYGIYIVLHTLIYGNPVPGYASLLVAILFIGSAQMVMLGIIGEYLGRTFNEVKRRPLYLLTPIFKVRWAPSKLHGERRRGWENEGRVSFSLRPTAC